LNNIGASKNNQSIQGEFLLELSDDNILDKFLFIHVDFKAHIDLLIL